MITNRKLLTLLGAATLTVLLAGGVQAAAGDPAGAPAPSAPWLAPTKAFERERVVHTPPRYPTGDEQECQWLGC